MKAQIGKITIEMTYEQASLLRDFCGAIGGLGSYTNPLVLGESIKHNTNVRSSVTDPLYNVLETLLNGKKDEE